MKYCKYCKETKTIDSFGKQKDTKDGMKTMCKSCLKEYHIRYYQKNKNKIKHNASVHYKNHREEKLEYSRQYRQENKEIRNKREKERYHTDPVFKMRIAVSGAVNQTLRKNNSSKNGNSILDNLPYTMEELKEHLESQFTEGMSWDNHAKDGWHIDHIIPQSSLPFDSFDHPNFLKCWDLDNLQPLWAKDNLRKSNNIP